MSPRRNSRLLDPLLRVGLLIAFIAWPGVLVPTRATSAGFGLYDPGTLGGEYAEGHGISDSGNVLVGRAEIASGAYHAFVRNGSGARDLGTLGGYESIALAASGSVVVGRAEIPNRLEHAFAIDTSSSAPMQDLGTLGGTWSTAYDVRENLIVGASSTADDATLQAFVYENGVMAPLPVDLGGNSAARGVNNHGDIVGYACTDDFVCEAFLYRAGALDLLGTLGGTSVAVRINDDSQVVGTSWLSDQFTTRAFIHENGAMRDLGTLGGARSEGIDINNRGEIVGRAQDTAGAFRAFLWRDGIMIDLNSLIAPESGWRLTVATGISEGGQIVGIGTVNGVSRAFLLTPATDLAVQAGGVRGQVDSNLPQGVEVGQTVRYVVSVQALSDEPRTVYDSRVIHTLSGPAEYVSVESTGEAVCELTPRVVSCDVAPVDSTGLGREIVLTARTTGQGAFSQSAALLGSTPDPVPTNDRVTEDNRAIALADVGLAPGAVAGGRASSARVLLTEQAPASGAIVRLTSSRPEIAPVPDTVLVPPGTDRRAFNVIPAVVSEPTKVEITASYGLVTHRVSLTVLPPKLNKLYLTPTTVTGGCGSSSGKIALSGPAPTGGALVRLVNTNGSAKVPASVLVPAGAAAQTFTVTTDFLTMSAAGSVTAEYGGVAEELALTVRPLRVETLTLTADSVKGSTSVVGRLVLECAAAGPLVVGLTSGDPSIATPMVAGVTVPKGGTTASFGVRTSAVRAAAQVKIYATVFGSREAATLTVIP